MLEWREQHLDQLRSNWELAQWPITLRPIEPLRSLVSMVVLRPVVWVEHLGGFRLRVTFTDELVRELDFDGVLTGGVFVELEDETLSPEWKPTTSEGRSTGPTASI